MLKNFTLAAFLLLTTSYVTAQTKIAYIHMQQLISSMPETKRALDTLQQYEQELNKDGQVLVAEFQKRVAIFTKDEPTMKADIKDIRIKELETAKASIDDYKMRMEQKLALREQALTDPIIAKAKKAVADLAAEKGFVCVLDSSKDIIVASTCEDLMAPAKLKLGIK
jgi:outer membrane protein